MASETNQSIRNLGDVLKFIADSAGGTVPATTDEEYLQWVRWVGIVQEMYAVRGFWRRLLTREEIEIEGDTTVLPDRFHKPNGLYILEVDGVDYTDPFDKQVSVEMIGDVDDSDYGKWQMRFKTTQDKATAIMWYFAAPPVPTAESDLLLLPGDMVGYGVRAMYFNTIGAEGSEDKAEGDAENRFLEYLSLEMIPDKSELITITHKKQDRIAYQKQFYYKANRYYRGN